ncbi:MAG: BON domain-containing protein [Gammaproteobacteria bacterium]|nr:BON domain-containing protein [Gammaproteobacteria bacterium]
MIILKALTIRTLATFVILSGLLSLQGCAAVFIAGAAGGGILAHDKRTRDAIVDDQSIEHHISGKLSANKEIRMKSHINVVSYNAIVLLTGETPDENMRSRAADIARNSAKVKRVYNALKIMKPTSLKSRNNDTWITTKVKTQLLGKKEIDGFRIKVITENASVFLMGLIPKAQADLAADIVSHVTGVKRVIKVFEYVN